MMRAEAVAWLEVVALALALVLGAANHKEGHVLAN